MFVDARRRMLSRACVVCAGCAAATAGSAAAVDGAIVLVFLVRGVGRRLAMAGVALLVSDFVYHEFLFRIAALPAMSPVADEVVEKPPLKIQTWSDADGQVVQIHLVSFLMRQQQAQMACDGE